MVKVKVLKPFADINDFARKYTSGEEIEVSVERAEKLIELGLVESENKDGIDLDGHYKTIISQIGKIEDAN